MKKRINNFSMLSGAIIAFVLIAFAVQTSNANTVSNQNAIANIEMEKVTINGIVYLNVVDGKCGEGTVKTEKKTETKAKAKTSEGKCGEGKCGEGKCGTGTAKAEKKTDAKVKSSETKSTSEGKCGEGTSKTEKSTSKKAKTSEGKCGVA